MKPWIKIWKYLDDNDTIETIIQISRETKTSYPSTLHAIHFLESIGYITLMGTGLRKSIHKTEKFFTTRKTILEIYNQLRKTK